MGTMLNLVVCYHDTSGSVNALFQFTEALHICNSTHDGVLADTKIPATYRAPRIHGCRPTTVPSVRTER